MKASFNLFLSNNTKSNPVLLVEPDVVELKFALINRFLWTKACKVNENPRLTANIHGPDLSVECASIQANAYHLTNAIQLIL